MNRSSPPPGGGRSAGGARREPGGGEGVSPHPARFAHDPPAQSTSDVSDVDRNMLAEPGNTRVRWEGAGVALIIPVLDEADTIGDVVRAVPRDVIGEVIVIDGDGSDDPAELPRLLAPILAGERDFVIGSRVRGAREPGSLGVHQRIAGHIAGLFMRALYGVRYTDMCPLRSIRRDALERLGMREKTYGWNLEMQMRAARAGLRIL